jgi:ABC-type lipoprotein export system ATPase subunit
MMALVEVRHVTKRYQNDGASVAAVQDVSMTVDEGQWISLMGRSGCGKSTLLNLCGAMDFPSEGTIVIEGAITSELDDAALTKLRREKIGFVFQSFQLLHTLTVVENVEVPLQLARKPNVRKTAMERLAWVDISELAGRFPHQLSGGQQQRVAIARALAQSPALLLADEPTGNLDTATSDSILELLARICRDLGTAILMATHNPESAALTDRTIRMRDGRIEHSL